MKTKPNYYYCNQTDSWWYKTSRKARIRAIIAVCPVCGETFPIASSHYRPNRTTCGHECAAVRKKQSARKGSESPTWKGFAEISAAAWNGCKRAAKKRALEWDITIEDGWSIYLRQNKKCALTGLPIRFECQRKDPIKRTASLDRIDSSKGYTIDNVWWVHKKINRCKQEYTLRWFLEMCKAVRDNADAKEKRKRS